MFPSTRSQKSSGGEKSSTSKTSTNTVSTSQHSNPNPLKNQYSNYHEYLMYLQRTIGNQAVGRLLRSGNLQRKLNIGPANDKYEQEADDIADQVVSMSDAITKEQYNSQTTEAHTSTLSRKPLVNSITALQRKPLNPELILQTKPEDEKEEIQEEPIQRQVEATDSDDEGQAKLIQRTCSTCQKEYNTAKLQRRPILPLNLCPACRTSSLQRKFSNFQSKLFHSPFSMQSKPLIQRKDIPTPVPESIEPAINSSKYGGKPLSTNERSYFEPRFGTSFANVRLHTDSKAAQLSRSINARAFTTGNNIYFGHGEYSPNTIQGKRLIAHELVHTIQQESITLQSKFLIQKDDLTEPTEQERWLSQTSTSLSGNQIYICSKDLDSSPIGKHAFFRKGGLSTGHPTYSLVPVPVTDDCWQGIPIRNATSDVTANASCIATPITPQQMEAEHNQYPIGHYCTLGPNSNTYAGKIMSNLGHSALRPPGTMPGYSSAYPSPRTFSPDRYNTLAFGCTYSKCITYQIIGDIPTWDLLIIGGSHSVQASDDIRVRPHCETASMMASFGHYTGVRVSPANANAIVLFNRLFGHSRSTYLPSTILHCINNSGIQSFRR